MNQPTNFAQLLDATERAYAALAHPVVCTPAKNAERHLISSIHWNMWLAYLSSIRSTRLVPHPTVPDALLQTGRLDIDLASNTDASTSLVNYAYAAAQRTR